jgi:uncharacterized iron-regulated protein
MLPRRTIAVFTILLLGLFLAFSSWAGLSAETETKISPSTFEAWQVLDVQTGKLIAFDEWVTLLAEQEVIYLGEEHRNQWHIEAALKVLRAIMDRGTQPLLAMEMFGWDGQAAIDRYLHDSSMTREQFLKASHWEQNWGGAFHDYEPLVAFAHTSHLSLLALNPPRPLVRNVSAHGLKYALNDPEITAWGLDGTHLVEDAAYREVILRQLQLCHGGLAEEAYERMYQASMFRDEGMAKTIADFLGSASGDPTSGVGPLVSYTGGGHIQYHLPVPKRVSRRRAGAVKQKTVYMTSFRPDHPEEAQELLRDGIADYLWLTPVSAGGPAQRCR